MTKTSTAAALKPAQASKKISKPAAEEVEQDLDEEQGAGGAFFAIQQPLIHLIEEYLLTHPHGGKRMTIRAFCEKADLTVANVTGIINGNRWVAKSSRETIEKLAAVLEIPVLQVFILSGFITGKDVVMNVNIDETVAAIYRQMVKDKHMSFKAPTAEEWDSWPMGAKLHMCMMYEALVSKVLLRYAGG